MAHQQYNKKYRSQCIDAFDSNVGKYFDLTERKEFIEFLDSLNDLSTYFVCIRDGRVVACGGVDKKSTIASLDWGMVHRDFHGQGLGTHLTDFRLSQLKADNTIDLVTIETSQHTEGFYIKRGFITTKVVKNGFGQGIDCVYMQCSVA
ncbi:MAG: GNAT family N-acetyltransferase [Algicola sp.]|nr:GNAT family N-acetyltransferase [Algicola sp.]